MAISPLYQHEPTSPELAMSARPATTPALPPLALGAALVAAVIASVFGVLDGNSHHPDLRLGGAMLLAVAGTAIVMATRHLASGSEPALDPATGMAMGPATAVRPLQGAWATRGARQANLASLIAPFLAFLSMAAALIHFAVIQQHWSEFALYGLFFVAVGLAQALWAILAVTRPSRLLYLAGAVGNLAVVAAWAVTRTVGSLVGPAAHETEVVGFGDLVSTLFEALIVLGCLLLLRRRVAARRVAQSKAEAIIGILALAVTAVAILGLFSSVGGPPFVSHVG